MSGNNTEDPCGRQKQLLNPSFKGSRRLNPHLLEDFQRLTLDVARRASVDEKPPPAMVSYPTGLDPTRAGVSDLCDFFFGNGDDHMSKESDIQIMSPGLQDFGGVEEFSGQAVTIACYESNPLVRKTLNQDGTGKVLVIDGGGSLKCALIGDLLSELAVQRGWSGMIINGCVRDTKEIGGMDVGIKALAAMPLKPGKRDMGKLNVPVNVCGAIIRPGDWIYADTDGVIVSPVELKFPEGGVRIELDRSPQSSYSLAQTRPHSRRTRCSLLDLDSRLRRSR